MRKTINILCTVNFYPFLYLCIIVLLFVIESLHCFYSAFYYSFVLLCFHSAVYSNYIPKDLQWEIFFWKPVGELGKIFLETNISYIDIVNYCLITACPIFTPIAIVTWTCRSYNTRLCLIKWTVWDTRCSSILWRRIGTSSVTALLSDTTWLRAGSPRRPQGVVTILRYYRDAVFIQETSLKTKTCFIFGNENVFKVFTQLEVC